MWATQRHTARVSTGSTVMKAPKLHWTRRALLTGPDDSHRDQPTQWMSLLGEGADIGVKRRDGGHENCHFRSTNNNDFHVRSVRCLERWIRHKIPHNARWLQYASLGAPNGCQARADGWILISTDMATSLTEASMPSVQRPLSRPCLRFCSFFLSLLAYS